VPGCGKKVVWDAKRDVDILPMRPHVKIRKNQKRREMGNVIRMGGCDEKTDAMTGVEVGSSLITGLG
jgi:hypothetical protein